MAASPPLSLAKQIAALENLCEHLVEMDSVEAKLDFLNKHPEVVKFFADHPSVETLLKNTDADKQYAVKAVIAIGQGPVVFHQIETLRNPIESVKALADKLLDMDKFYDTLGGISGYQLTVLNLLNGIDVNNGKEEHIFEDPVGTDLTSDAAVVNEAVKWGIASLNRMGEVYPLGGAGDRLNLTDPLTGEPLPVAQLEFAGRTLLEGLIRDLQGREYLYYKLFGKCLITPVAVMTSHEKDNHRRILALCERCGWFGRPKESFNFFIQPLVPMVAYDGLWAVKGPLQPVFKPGGHGVMWKAAEDAGIFAWFEGMQRGKVIVRQINNPMAGLDFGLLALAGLGCRTERAFGFASCERVVGAAEGMNVVRTVKHQGAYECSITNVEYTDFKKCGIPDVPKSPDSPFSRFPANTNILFADLNAVRDALENCTIPGVLINMKSKVLCQGPEGAVEKNAGRLESTMQNIADCITDRFTTKPQKSDYTNLQTFLTYNHRRKTISVVKQNYTSGASLADTPVESFYNLTANYRDLLANHCGFELPTQRDIETYLAHGPEIFVSFHPALGTLYSVIGQKIRGGKIAEGSDWIMEVAEADVENLDLSGSLIIEAENILGDKSVTGVIDFDSDRSGKCTLINVTVKNAGAAPVNGIEAWRFDWERKEALHITLRGNAEFIAENVVLEGDIHFDVPDGQRLVVYSHEGETEWYLEKIPHSTWKWEYSIDAFGKIELEKSRFKG